MTQLNSGHYSSPAKASPALATVKQFQDMPWHWNTSCATSFLYQCADGAHADFVLNWPSLSCFPTTEPHLASPSWRQNQAPHLCKSPLPAANLKTSSVLQHACSLLLQFQSSAPLRCCPMTHISRRSFCRPSFAVLPTWEWNHTAQLLQSFPHALTVISARYKEVHHPVHIPYHALIHCQLIL